MVNILFFCVNVIFYIYFCVHIQFNMCSGLIVYSYDPVHLCRLVFVFKTPFVCKLVGHLCLVQPLVAVCFVDLRFSFVCDLFVNSVVMFF